MQILFLGIQFLVPLIPPLLDLVAPVMVPLPVLLSSWHSSLQYLALMQSSHMRFFVEWQFQQSFALFRVRSLALAVSFCSSSCRKSCCMPITSSTSCFVFQRYH